MKVRHRPWDASNQTWTGYAGFVFVSVRVEQDIVSRMCRQLAS